MMVAAGLTIISSGFELSFIFTDHTPRALHHSIFKHKGGVTIKVQSAIYTSGGLRDAARLG